MKKRKRDRLANVVVIKEKNEMGKLLDENMSLKVELLQRDEELKILTKKTENFSKLMSHSKGLVKEICKPERDYLGLVPIENPFYASLISRAEHFNHHLPIREYFYVPRDIWHIYLGIVNQEIKNLVIAGLPADNLENLASIRCEDITFVSYDGNKIKAPEIVKVKTPEQYFKGFFSEVDALYTKLDLLTQYKDGRTADIPKDVKRLATLIDEELKSLPDLTQSSYSDINSMLDRLRIQLVRNGTIDNFNLKEGFGELYKV